MNRHFRVQNRIEECRDLVRRPMVNSSAAQVVLHRTIWEPKTAVGVCKRFQTEAVIGGLAGLGAYTGGENPYHFLIQSDGEAVQCISLNERGAHARRWNSTAIAVAVMWDTLNSELPDVMWVATRELLTLLCLHVGGVDGFLFGHDELQSGSSDESKICPGIDMTAVRTEIRREVNDYWAMLRYLGLENLLSNRGIVLREYHGV